MDRKEGLKYSILDYVDWLGDVELSQYPFCEVDALILASLSYIHFREDKIPNRLDYLEKSFLKNGIKEVQEEFRVRVVNDCHLLEKASHSKRFGSLLVTRSRDIFSQEEQIQFSAYTILLPDKTHVIAFRGTDNTVIGWKEDFNMSFSPEVPAQREALKYLEEEAALTNSKLIVTGHSKGGNLAVYSSAKASKKIRERISAIYNFDGPGFLSDFLSSTGYKEITEKIHTFVPRSSIIGMLLDRREKHLIVESSQIGIYQHDPYSWRVLGVHFVLVNELSTSANLFDKSLKSWLYSIPADERSLFIDSVFSWLSTADVTRPFELKHPKALLSVFSSVKEADPTLRKNMMTTLKAFFEVAATNLKSSLKKES